MPKLLILSLITSFTIAIAAAQEEATFMVKGRKSKIILTHPDGKETELRMEGFVYERASVFLVPDPFRLVVDLMNSKIRINKTFPVKKSPLIKMIRLGTHSDRLRMVLDLDTTAEPPFSFTDEAGVLTLKIGGSSENESETAQIPTPSPSPETELNPIAISEPITPTLVPEVKIPKVFGAQRQDNAPTPTPTESVQASPTATSTAEATQTPTITLTNTPVTSSTPVPPSPTPKPTVAITQTVVRATATSSVTTLNRNFGDEQELVDIQFNYATPGRAPLVKLFLNTKPEFQLIRKDDRTYQMTISQARLKGKFLALPLFPPHDFLGFTLVQATESNSGVEITIGVDRGIRLGAVPKGNEILVRALNK